MDTLTYFKPIDNLRFRIIQYSVESEVEYYLQRKILFGLCWQTMCGYNRGSSGHFSYEYEESNNPFFLVEYTLPMVLYEEESPRINWYTKFLFWVKRSPRLKKKYITRSYRPNALVEAVNIHRAEGYVVTNPYPSLKKIF